MRTRPLVALIGLLALSGCASLVRPAPDALARMPVVTFPDTPPAGDFILKLPAGKPIPSRVAIEGSALATSAEQTLSVTLPRDLYVHKRWVSEDGRHWAPGQDLLKFKFTIALPSYEHPKPGEIVLHVDRRDAN